MATVQLGKEIYAHQSARRSQVSRDSAIFRGVLQERLKIYLRCVPGLSFRLAPTAIDMRQ